mgnify:CR=1 FL=1
MVGCAILLAQCGMVATAYAIPPEDTVPETPPPQVYTTSRGGVDLQTGTYLFSHEDLSIGGGHMDGGISLVRDYSTNLIAPYDNPPMAFGNYDHKLDVRIWIERIPDSPTPANWDWRATVQIGTQKVSFRRAGGSSTTDFKLEGNYGNPDQKLTYAAGNPYVYTDRQGTVYTFRGSGPSPSDGCAGVACAYVANIVKTSGERLDFNYVGTSPTLRSVISNRGYAMIFENSGTPVRLQKACVLNLAVSYYNGTDVCPGGARSVTYSYGTIPGYTGADFAYTDPGGHLYAYSANAFWEPDSTTPKLVLSLGARTAGLVSTFEVTRQDFAGGDWITYDYQPFPSDPTANLTREKAIVTDPTGTITATFKGRNYQMDNEWYYFVSQGPIKVVDQLNRTTINDFDVCISDFCGIGQIKSATLPEGNSIHYLYNGPGNVSERRQKPKTAGPADIVETAAFGYYGSFITYWGLAFKPTSVTDANGNITTIAYDTASALPTSVTSSAVGGLAPVKRYAYTQRYAWIKNSGGTSYVQASGQIWLLSEERTCKTTATVGASCAGGATDEIVTTYDYGPDSGPNNLLLRGMVVDAGSGTLNLRTCYGYDTYGNKISETEPRAGLGSCP